MSTVMVRRKFCISISYLEEQEQEEIRIFLEFRFFRSKNKKNKKNKNFLFSLDFDFLYSLFTCYPHLSKFTSHYNNTLYIKEARKNLFLTLKNTLFQQITVIIIFLLFQISSTEIGILLLIYHQKIPIKNL